MLVVKMIRFQKVTQRKLVSTIMRNGKRMMSVSVATTNFRERMKMMAWQIHSYGDLNDLQLSSVRAPFIKEPDNLLVKVEASSMNPIDTLMCSGYGRTLINLIRKEDDLPLILGRDFCGTVISKGHATRSDFKVGDKVYGFKPLNEQGTFAEVISVRDSYICHQPNHLNHIECASLVYATLTAWSALFVTGGLAFKKTGNIRVLILGASGGVGTSAIQLLKSQGCKVFGTCSKDAVPLLYKLGADVVFDYRDINFINQVANEGRFHIILDCAKFGSDNLPSSWNYDVYIALNSPLLHNTDNYGLLQGLCASSSSFVQANFKNFGKRYVRWGFFIPSERGFKFINTLISEGKIKPTLHKTLKFSQLPEAFQIMSSGHLRGKVVIDYL